MATGVIIFLFGVVVGGITMLVLLEKAKNEGKKE